MSFLEPISSIAAAAGIWLLPLLVVVCFQAAFSHWLQPRSRAVVSLYGLSLLSLVGLKTLDSRLALPALLILGGIILPTGYSLLFAAIGAVRSLIQPASVGWAAGSRPRRAWVRLGLGLGTGAVVGFCLGVLVSLLVSGAIAWLSPTLPMPSLLQVVLARSVYLFVGLGLAIGYGVGQGRLDLQRVSQRFLIHCVILSAMIGLIYKRVIRLPLLRSLYRSRR